MAIIILTTPYTITVVSLIGTIVEFIIPIIIISICSQNFDGKLDIDFSSPEDLIYLLLPQEKSYNNGRGAEGEIPAILKFSTSQSTITNPPDKPFVFFDFYSRTTSRVRS